MKGTITTCLADMINERFGSKRWEEILADAKIDAVTARLLLMPVADIDDHVAAAVLESTCRVLGSPLQEVADAFGEYWCCTYAPKMYRSMFRSFKSARDAVLAMDKVHVQVTATMDNARPPRFDYEWINGDVLEVTYKSRRNLLPIYVGLARGLGKYFGEHLTVTQVTHDRARIDFS